MKCRHCNNPLTHVFCDLQTCPPSNAMVKPELINCQETYFPLKTFVCEKCWLVQVDELEKAESIFNITFANAGASSPFNVTFFKDACIICNACISKSIFKFTPM